MTLLAFDGTELDKLIEQLADKGLHYFNLWVEADLRQWYCKIAHSTNPLFKGVKGYGLDKPSLAIQDALENIQEAIDEELPCSQRHKPKP